MDKQLIPSQRDMALSKAMRKPKLLKKSETTEFCSRYTLVFKVVSRIPIAVLILAAIFLTFIWSSSTTIISDNVVHVCVSSWKLGNLYCLSAGTQPHFEAPLPATNTSSYSNSEEKSLQAIKVVEEQIQLQRSWATNENHVTCDRGGIYVYDLPAKYNKDLIGQCRDMMPWMDFCKYFENEALGENIPELGKSWYKTHQYALEPIFHARILKHPCRVYDENQAKLFYVPYYGGLDILRWHFKNVSGDVKDALGLDLVKWLASRKKWIKNSGKDHVFVLGKISWDFRRNSGSPWGNRFLLLDETQNAIKLLIERQPWEVNDIGIPHPTNFHPHSDDDIIEWQLKIMRAPRKKLVSFAGAARPDQPESIRSEIIKQCNLANNSQCQLLDCSTGKCGEPDSIIRMFVGSEFCLQPPGDSPTRRSVFDSLISGCIPVLFDPFTAYYQYPWHLAEDHTRYSVFVDQKEMKQGKVNVVERLMNISGRERENMRRYIVYELLPGLVYGDLSSQLRKYSDAFTLTVNNLLERVNKM